MSTFIKRYNYYIYQRYNDLKRSEKDLNNYDLCKIFEYYTAIKLSEEYGKNFYEYMDIPPDFKEIKNMSKVDIGIDLCNLLDTIVQCKLRKTGTSLSWTDIGTFIGGCLGYCEIEKKMIIQWPKLILARNDDCYLTSHLKSKSGLYQDKLYNKDEMINYCNYLLENSPNMVVNKPIKKLRDYQIECIDLINDNGNIIICLPTGTGKNLIIVKAMQTGYKYLILTPRVILMDQIKEEILMYSPFDKSDIQCFGGVNKTIFNNKKSITICVYNSITLIIEYCNIFDKIFCDEAHHLYNPNIYYESILDPNNTLPDEEELDKKDKNQERKYTSIIRSLSKYNNNILLSATIDHFSPDWIYYKKDIREMINKQYLTDYTINIPVFNNDPSNRNICEYIIKNYRSIIIYCSNKKEGWIVNKLMNDILPNCSKYIDCYTCKEERNMILLDFKNGILPFLVNIRILSEGYNAPITQGVLFMHMSTSQTAIIQVIGRALRLHPTKKIATVILPYSLDDDANQICRFLNIISKNDSRIYKSYINKINGGYIEIFNSTEELLNDVKLRCELIYNSLGTLTNINDIWYNNFEKYKNYIDTYSRLPSDNDDIYLKKWYYTTNSYWNLKINIMKDSVIYDLWYDFKNKSYYSKFFIDVNITNWFIKLKEYTDFLDVYRKRPSNNDNQKLKSWGDNQQNFYYKKDQIMKIENIYNAWHVLINNEKYYNYFKHISQHEQWILNFEAVKNYIDTYNKLPIEKDNNVIYAQLGGWIHGQFVASFENRPKLKELWLNFTNNDKYKKYFIISLEDRWKINLTSIKTYFDDFNQLPTDKYLLTWFNNQMNFVRMTSTYHEKKLINVNNEIKKLWLEFSEDDKYKRYFKLGIEEVWKNNLIEVYKYTKLNNKLPSISDENEKVVILSKWLNGQIRNYKDSRDMLSRCHIRILWENFMIYKTDNNL